MFPVARALLIINRIAGTGQDQSTTEKLTSLFKQGLGELSELQVELVSSHTAARACAAKFTAESEAPALVVAGGGGGTLRAVIEAICDSKELPTSQNVCVGALRMGSGNVLAKQFGVPRDPIVGLGGLLRNLHERRTVACCVMRCETWTNSGTREVHYAVTLGGLGQFGRIPSDLARYHASFPVVHKSLARLFGIERLTNVEYVVALLIRSLSCMVNPDRAEIIEIQIEDHKERLRLLSGVLMSFPVAALPFKPDVSAEDEAACVFLIPLTGRFSPLLQIVAPRRLIHNTRRIRIERNRSLEVRLVDREQVEFFLDEDPVTTHKHFTFGVAGSIPFVPGPDYRDIASRGAYE